MFISNFNSGSSCSHKLFKCPSLRMCVNFVLCTAVFMCMCSLSIIDEKTCLNDPVLFFYAWLETICLYAHRSLAYSFFVWIKFTNNMVSGDWMEFHYYHRCSTDCVGDSLPYISFSYCKRWLTCSSTCSVISITANHKSMIFWQIFNCYYYCCLCFYFCH